MVALAERKNAFDAFMSRVWLSMALIGLASRPAADTGQHWQLQTFREICRRTRWSRSRVAHDGSC